MVPRSCEATTSGPVGGFVVVPRSGGGDRVLARLQPATDAAYRRLVASAAAEVERALGPNVFGNRVAPSSDLELRSWRGPWRSFAAARRDLRRQWPVLVKADVRDCYPSIAPAVVERSLLRLGAHLEIVRRLRRLLDAIGDDGVRGLPVGPEASAVLANAALLVMDGTLAAQGCPHVRWVDDVWAGARSGRHAERTLAALRRSLGRAGLELNEEKTMVIDSADALALDAETHASGLTGAMGGR
ncbi:MAG: RNA-directed DNA polymerase [Actinomycetota bacterium]